MRLMLRISSLKASEMTFDASGRECGNESGKHAWERGRCTRNGHRRNGNIRKSTQCLWSHGPIYGTSHVGDAGIYWQSHGRNLCRLALNSKAAALARRAREAFLLGPLTERRLWDCDSSPCTSLGEHWCQRLTSESLQLPLPLYTDSKSRADCCSWNGRLTHFLPLTRLRATSGI